MIFSPCTRFNTLALPHPAASPDPPAASRPRRHFCFFPPPRDTHTHTRQLSETGGYLTLSPFLTLRTATFPCSARRGRTIGRREEAEMTKSTNRRLRISRTARKVERRRLLRRDRPPVDRTRSGSNRKTQSVRKCPNTKKKERGRDALRWLSRLARTIARIFPR